MSKKTFLKIIYLATIAFVSASNSGKLNVAQNVNGPLLKFDNNIILDTVPSDIDYPDSNHSYSTYKEYSRKSYILYFTNVGNDLLIIGHNIYTGDEFAVDRIPEQPVAPNKRDYIKLRPTHAKFHPKMEFNIESNSIVPQRIFYKRILISR